MIYFLSTFHGSRIKGINPGIIVWCYFSFLFHQRAFGNFHFRHRCVGLGFQYADIEVTDFLWFERKSSSSNKVAPKCLHPWSAPPLHIQNADYTHTQLSPEKIRACKVYRPLKFFCFWVSITPATNTKKVLPSRSSVVFTPRLWTWPFVHKLYSSNERQEDNLLLS